MYQSNTSDLRGTKSTSVKGYGESLLFEHSALRRSRFSALQNPSISGTSGGRACSANNPNWRRNPNTWCDRRSLSRMFSFWLPPHWPSVLQTAGKFKMNRSVYRSISELRLKDVRQASAKRAKPPVPDGTTWFRSRSAFRDKH